MKNVNVTPIGEAIEWALKRNENYVNRAKKFISQFQEDEKGYMSDEAYMLKEKVGADDALMNFIQNVLDEHVKELKKSSGLYM